MSSLKTLQEAKKKKNDEFYTPYSMVESQSFRDFYVSGRIGKNQKKLVKKINKLF